VVRIAEIEAGSVAESLELRVGTRVIRINGQRVRDGIDLTYLLADGELELDTVDPDGRRSVLEIVLDDGEPLGIVPAPDKIRECANECVFCFIDGNPEGVRPSLWVRDDDFRLSFTYGSYVTLTNLGPKGFQRLIDQRLSPLYVSVHATDPDVRVRLLKNDRAGDIMDRLRLLTNAGLEVHTQAVICPEWNDGPHLERTIRDLYSLGEGVRTLSVVPVGLTRYNLDRPVRLLTSTEARHTLEQVEAVREQALSERGYGWCYAADELFLGADHPLPDARYYDDLALTENGVGAVRLFLDAFDEGVEELPRSPAARIRILTGRSMEPFLSARAGRLSNVTGAEVEVIGVTNRFYGDSVTTAGLLAGEDLVRAVQDPREGDVVLLPAEALNQEEMFVDSYPLEALRAALAPARVIPGHELTATLRSL
jgi:putative radical SAM enzyme (TIGR03279 family)